MGAGRCGGMADATDLKSVDPKGSCGFESRHRYHLLNEEGWSHGVWSAGPRAVRAEPGDLRLDCEGCQPCVVRPEKNSVPGRENTYDRGIRALTRFW
jgi:hypothetical protein